MEIPPSKPYQVAAALNRAQLRQPLRYCLRTRRRRARQLFV